MPTTPHAEWKIVPLTDAKVSSDGTGSLTGYASVFNGIDSYGDTIPPGAYTNHLDQFVDHGFIAWQHNWSNMIGTVASAKQDAHGLLITADFHSTPDAQQARTIAAERLARGKSMGLSIGYIPHKWSFEDAPSGKGQIRVLEDIEVFETSLVSVPADAAAGVLGVKSHPLTERPSNLWLIPGFKAEETPPPDETTEDPPADDTADSHGSFADHGEQLLLSLSDYASRAASLSELRAKEGRVLSEANRRRLSGLLDAMAQAHAQIEELLSATDPAPPPPDPKAQQQAEIAELFARFSTVHAVHRDLSHLTEART